MNIKLPRQTYVLGPKLYTLGASDYYPTQYVNEDTESKTPKKEMTVFDRLLEDDPLGALPGVVKIARDPNDNDLLTNEQDVLRGLCTQIEGHLKNAWVGNCIPEIVETGTHDKRTVTVFRVRPQHVSFERLLQLFPKGLDYLDVVWMWKRFLATLWFVHRQGIVHGGCLPPHLLVHPTEHGPQLIEWSYATRSRERLKAMVSEYQVFYPPEVLRRQEVGVSLDLFMLAKCVVVLLGGDPNTNKMPDSVPKPFQALVLDCLHEDRWKRTEDAGTLHEQVDSVMVNLVGKHKYRPLRLPTTLTPKSNPNVIRSTHYV
jgi:hypothetical protein